MTRAEVARAAAALAGIARRWRERQCDGTAEVARQARWLLQEMGVRCGSEADLQGLRGVLIQSPRGPEFIISTRLDAAQRLELYAHMLAHLLVGAMSPTWGTRFEYPAHSTPAHLTAHERREEAVCDAIARALLLGCPEGAPYYLAEAPPPARRRRGRRQVVAALALNVVHRVSLTLYWRSQLYQRLRAHPDVTRLARDLQRTLGAAA